MTGAWRVAVVGFVALCVLVVAAAVGLAVLTGTSGTVDATVDTFEPRVAVGNESVDAPGGSGEVVTCTDRGPIPGNAALERRLELSRPAGDEGPRNADYRVAVTVVVTVGDGERFSSGRSRSHGRPGPLPSRGRTRTR